MISMTFAFGCQAAIFGEQRNEPYIWYGEVSSTNKKGDLTPKALSGKWLCQMAGKGGA